MTTKPCVIMQTVVSKLPARSFSKSFLISYQLRSKSDEKFERDPQISSEKSSLDLPYLPIEKPAVAGSIVTFRSSLFVSMRFSQSSACNCRST